MSIRILPDENEPSAAIEMAIEKVLPDYDLEEVTHSKPRDVDGILVTEGFRDLVDDARGVLTELLEGSGMEIEQVTGAICPGNELYRPGLWIVLRDAHAAAGAALSKQALERVTSVAMELAKRLQIS